MLEATGQTEDIVAIPDRPPKRIDPPARLPVHIVIADEDKLRGAGEDVEAVNAKIEQLRKGTTS